MPGMDWRVLAASLAIVFPTASAQAYVNNQSAEIVIGQPDFISNTPNARGLNSNTVLSPKKIYYDGTQLYIADSGNNRVLIYNKVPRLNNASADVVIGQPNMTSSFENNGGLNANTLKTPHGVCCDGVRLFIADSGNNRVLIYNNIPTINNVFADVVIGQPNMTSSSANNGGINSNTLEHPLSVYCNGVRLYMADSGNNRVLIYCGIPNSNNAPADIVIGEPDMTTNSLHAWAPNTLHFPTGVVKKDSNLYVADTSDNRCMIYHKNYPINNESADIVIGQPEMTSHTANNGGLNANTLYTPKDIFCDGVRLYISDSWNNRVLIFNSIPLINYSSADYIIGQVNMTSNIANYSGVNADTLFNPDGIFSDDNRLLISDTNNNRVLIYYPPQIFSITPNYSAAGKVMQILGYGSRDAASAKLVRPGCCDIASTSTIQKSNYNNLYSFDLTQAAPNCYDLTVTDGVNTRLLKQAFTVMSLLQAPVDWKINDLGTIGGNTMVGNFCGLGIGDIEQTYTQQLYTANQGRSPYQIKKVSYGWSSPTALPQAVGAGFTRLLSADGNGDGAWELYGASADNHVYEFKTGWVSTDMGAGSGKVYGLAGLDTNHDGITEIYASCEQGRILCFTYNSDWGMADITTTQFPESQGNALAAGDGNNDGNLELYSANANSKIYQYACVGGAWQVSVAGMAADTMLGVAVGDGDDNGQQEVYGSSGDGYVYQCKWDGSIWTWRTIGNPGGGIMHAVVVSDGDNDGANEVYAACGNGHVYEFTCESGNWTTRDLGGANTPLYALAVGDADNDHHFEVYALGQNNHLYQFQPFAQGAPTPTPALQPPQSFFKIYRNQINPNHGEQAAIRWTQTQTGPVTVVVYNLLGDKIVTLADHKDFPAGQYNELTWDGRNCGGAAVGSGIYIVLLQTDGRQERGKIAVLK